MLVFHFGYTKWYMRIAPPSLPPLDLPRLLYVRTDRRVRKPRATVVMLHGLGNTGRAWDEMIAKLPSDIRIIVIDLLGFGKSPKPLKASYNVRIQARSVAMTLMSLRLSGRVILVGHSMGSLISIELAKRYPLFIKGLVLCSPPLYRTKKERVGAFMAAENLLTSIYSKVSIDATARPEYLLKLAKTAMLAKITSPSLEITEQTIAPYATALKASIIDQTSYRDIQEILPRVKIIYGTLDPFVIPKNLKIIAKNSNTISAQSIIAFHEVTRPYFKPIKNAIEDLLPQKIDKLNP